MWAAMSMTVVLTLVVLGRLTYLQLLEHRHFTTLSQDNRLKVVPIPPTRGLIYSRDGQVLAENRPSFSLEMVPERVRDFEATLPAVAQLVNLDEDEIARIDEERRRARGFDAIVIKTGMSENEVSKFSVNRHRFPGFAVVARLARYYPFGEELAHVVGYVGRINETEVKAIDPVAYRGTSHIGKTGVELAREEILRGKVGYQQVEVNAQGRVLRVVTDSPPVPGHDVYLTLDLGLQKTATAALTDNNGAIVALNPSTGEVLAFVSRPSFDPNLFVNGISKDRYKALRNSKDRPLFNRALQAQYPPGSTVKPMVALAGLESGTRHSDDDTWCPGWYSLDGDDHRYRDWLKRGHGHVNLTRSIAESCDVYYYALARDLGIARIHSMLSEFGLGKATGIDLPGETAGLLPSAEWKRRARNLPWYPGETLITGIGQGFMLTSPLQLAYAVSTIANHGRRMAPHVVGQIEDPLARVASEIGIHERPAIEISNSQYWDDVINGMLEVVHGTRGTARRSGDGAFYRYAGKTGTAQLFGIAQDAVANNDETPKLLRDHALFIAFAPEKDPEIAVAIIVENGGSGSGTAAPIARLMLDYFLLGAASISKNNG
ncbi:MAG: penicillin-binding protein 2 [Gammaproteobacteria bacterium]|jgi:penicillin-binding protein 2